MGPSGGEEGADRSPEVGFEVYIAWLLVLVHFYFLVHYGGRDLCHML